MRPPLDVLVVGAGPAGLATAIGLKRQLDAEGRDVSLAVIDKAPQAGYHNLSGAVIDPRPLDELTPGWREHRLLARRVAPVERDDLYFLLGSRAIRIPSPVVPAAMGHGGDVIFSISRLVSYLAAVAAELGIEVYSGFSARELMVEGGMTPAQALAATTSSAAELLGVADELGTLEPGKRADVVVVEGDAFNFGTLSDRVEAVYQDGRRVVG